MDNALRKAVNFLFICFLATIMILLWNINFKLSSVDENLNDIENSTREATCILYDIKQGVKLEGNFDQDFIDEIKRKGEFAILADQAIKKMTQILDNGRLGIFSRFIPFTTTQSDRDDFDRQAIYIHLYWREVQAARPLFKSEIKNLLKNLLPNSSFSDASNRGLLAGFAHQIASTIADCQTLVNLKNEDGSFPKDIRERWIEARKLKREAREG